MGYPQIAQITQIVLFYLPHLLSAHFYRSFLAAPWMRGGEKLAGLIGANKNSHASLIRVSAIMVVASDTHLEFLPRDQTDHGSAMAAVRD
jgi:hypothetical protein